MAIPVPRPPSLAAVGGQRDLEGLVLRVVRVPVQPRHPPRAELPPALCLPIRWQKPAREFAAQPQVSLNLAPPAGQARRIGER